MRKGRSHFEIVLLDDHRNISTKQEVAMKIAWQRHVRHAEFHEERAAGEKDKIKDMGRNE